MSGFIATSPPEAASPAGAVVKAGPFWPDIDLNLLRDSVRIGNATIPDPRLIFAVQGAILSAQVDLACWQAAQIAAGYATLRDVPSAAIGTETRLTLLWRRAVICYAAADLTETHRDITVTPAGAARAEETMPTAIDHRRNGLLAIRDMLGVGRTLVELI